jgi:hypothetical protein
MDLPPRVVVGERPIIPAEDIGIETFDLFKDIRITYYGKRLKGLQSLQRKVCDENTDEHYE